MNSVHKSGHTYTARVCFFLLMAVSVLLPVSTAMAVPTRLKDIISIEGVRDNQLVGYGLVVGLDRSGDIILNTPYTEQSINAMLERLGINTKGRIQRGQNVAAVMVTATLPAFARQGTRIDVSIGSIGDAQDLKGGILLATPLLGADGEVYAVAQGGVAVAGFSAQGDAGSITQGVPTSGRIANGAIVEREVEFELSDLNTIKLSLHNPDLTTAQRIADKINDHLGMFLSLPLDPATVQLNRPVGYEKSLVQMLIDMERLEIEPDQRARVVIDERTGIIVMGSEVRINSVAIAQGNLTITISETPLVSQPAPFSEQGQTAIVPRTNIAIDDGSDRQLGILPPTVTLQELVDGLNALGVGPRDMISILQAIKAAGAMQAELEVM
ncbi:flagellar P-ring protein precursor FlgI [Eilatimonas milleporae]|uniref:Flagellar P-ring protein n=2 Tax=Eilatimonas milleporae TaxID=911205 RepID=A0A3M0CH49_9PROT|nr:flagellar P-ring protein precursor FlgI [Eilatimonas milleporae]